MSTVLEELTSSVSFHVKTLSQIGRLQDAVEALGLDDLPGIWSAYINAFQERRLTLTIRDFENLQRITALLKPKVGSIEKTFDESSGNVGIRFEHDGCVFAFHTLPGPSCQIEEVEEIQVIPARAEETRTIKKFVLKGGCDPLLRAEVTA